MHGRSGPTRPRTSRVATMSARQRRSELAAIIASGIAKSIAARANPPNSRKILPLMDLHSPPDRGSVCHWPDARSERAQGRRARMTETDPIPKQIAALERMTVGQLQRR
jgi:hypothetical protein